MKFFSLLLVSVMSIGVLGSKTAGGWEAAAYYNIYRADYAANGDQGTVGQGCKGTHSQGGCNFAEFIDHIQKHSISLGKDAAGNKIPLAGKFDPAKVPAGLDLENPDIKVVSGIMDWEGTKNLQYPKKKGSEPFWKYDGTYEKKNLLGPDGAKAANHGDVLKALTDRFDNARSKLGDGKIQRFLDNLRGCFPNIVLAREMDQAENLIRDFQLVVLDPLANGSIKDEKNKLVSPTKDYTDPASGETYKVWDSDKMSSDILNNPELSADKKKAVVLKVTEYATDYNVKAELSEKKGSSGVTHYRDITAAQALNSRIQGPPKSC